MSEPRISHAIPVSPNTLRELQQEEAAMQVESEEDLSQYYELDLFNPAQLFKKSKTLEERLRSLPQKKEAQESEEKKILSVEEVDEAAARFQRNNEELQSRSLLILRSRITAGDTPEEALEKVLASYPDPALADEALDFLIETADPSTLAIIQQAKERLNATRGREVRAGRNMGTQAREFAKEGLGSPTSLRDMYRDITGNPREPLKLFDELAEQFRYEKLKPVITFLLHSLGSDLKSKGSSISHAELKRLIDEIRSLQGILGVYRFFQSRMGLMNNQFSRQGLLFPPRLDFELLARLFIKMLAERYMNPEKILQTARLLGVDDEVTAQIIIYTQMRDAVKQVAPRYYRNLQHRDELLKAFISALEELEDDLEEEEEEDDEDDK